MSDHCSVILNVQSSKDSTNISDLTDNCSHRYRMLGLIYPMLLFGIRARR